MCCFNQPLVGLTNRPPVIVAVVDWLSSQSLRDGISKREVIELTKVDDHGYVLRIKRTPSGRTETLGSSQALTVQVDNGRIRQLYRQFWQANPNTCWSGRSEARQAIDVGIAALEAEEA